MLKKDKQELHKIIEELFSTLREDIEWNPISEDIEQLMEISATVGQIILLKQLHKAIKTDLEECLSKKALINLVKYISTTEGQIKRRLIRLKDSVGYEEKDYEL